MRRLGRGLYQGEGADGFTLRVEHRGDGWWILLRLAVSGIRGSFAWEPCCRFETLRDARQAAAQHTAAP